GRLELGEREQGRRDHLGVRADEHDNVLGRDLVAGEQRHVSELEVVIAGGGCDADQNARHLVGATVTISYREPGEVAVDDAVEPVRTAVHVVLPVAGYHTPKNIPCFLCVAVRAST